MDALLAGAVLLAIGGAVGVGGALFWMDYRRQREMVEAARLDRSGNDYIQSLLLRDANKLRDTVEALTARVDRLENKATVADYFDSSK
jgi:uncharacterized membrane protein YccC